MHACRAAGVHFGFRVLPVLRVAVIVQEGTKRSKPTLSDSSFKGFKKGRRCLIVCLVLARPKVRRHEAVIKSLLKYESIVADKDLKPLQVKRRLLGLRQLTAVIP